MGRWAGERRWAVGPVHVDWVFGPVHVDRAFGPVHVDRAVGPVHVDRAVGPVHVDGLSGMCMSWAVGHVHVMCRWAFARRWAVGLLHVDGPSGLFTLTQHANSTSIIVHCVVRTVLKADGPWEGGIYDIVGGFFFIAASRGHAGLLGAAHGEEASATSRPAAEMSLKQTEQDHHHNSGPMLMQTQLQLQGSSSSPALSNFSARNPTDIHLSFPRDYNHHMQQLSPQFGRLLVNGGGSLPFSSMDHLMEGRFGATIAGGPPIDFIMESKLEAIVGSSNPSSCDGNNNNNNYDFMGNNNPCSKQVQQLGLGMLMANHPKEMTSLSSDLDFHLSCLDWTISGLSSMSPSPPLLSSPLNSSHGLKRKKQIISKMKIAILRPVILLDELPLSFRFQFYSSQ
ncbi:hypothetical protein SAY87_019557 [Trapa incisa]|uniref:Uncharacterized protein n=1 Tax=Trapa incisa TaxID=236973 RepID=A0AAN7K4U3_9MYRT|nr:hypothetical protein SAY87_019557 [Trapa incisa]